MHVKVKLKINIICSMKLTRDECVVIELVLP